MFGPVITTEAHPAVSGARTHSNNTAEVSAMIEALSFLGPHGPVVRDANSCTYYDSKHAAGVCLGTIQARTQVQRALACQQSMLCVQHKLRSTMQHVYGHTGNLGNECAGDAAALGTLGLVSNHNLATRWVRHNFDTSVFVSCTNIGEVFTGFFVFNARIAPLVVCSQPFCLRSILQYPVVPQLSHGKPNLVCLYHFEF